MSPFSGWAGLQHGMDENEFGTTRRRIPVGVHDGNGPRPRKFQMMIHASGFSFSALLRLERQPNWPEQATHSIIAPCPCTGRIRRFTSARC
jgi:hypothetical protein